MTILWGMNRRLWTLREFLAPRVLGPFPARTSRLERLR
jgi:hypothetical protein